MNLEKRLKKEHLVYNVDFSLDNFIKVLTHKLETEVNYTIMVVLYNDLINVSYISIEHPIIIGLSNNNNSLALLYNKIIYKINNFIIENQNNFSLTKTNFFIEIYKHRNFK
jgi:hypothetical protein